MLVNFLLRNTKVSPILNLNIRSKKIKRLRKYNIIHGNKTASREIKHDSSRLKLSNKKSCNNQIIIKYVTIHYLK